MIITASVIVKIRLKVEMYPLAHVYLGFEQLARAVETPRLGLSDS